MNPTPQHKDTTLDEMFDASPIDKEVPEDIWGTIYPTWTGLWTDGYGEWDEKQPSDIYPVSELLSNERLESFKQALLQWRDKAVVEAVKNVVNIWQVSDGDEVFQALVLKDYPQLKETPNED